VKGRATKTPDRLRTGVTLVVAASLLAAACGTDDSGSDAAVPAPTTGQEGGGTTSQVDLPEGWAPVLDELRCDDTTVGEFPRTVVHDAGETVLEAPPQRVVSIEGTTSLDLLLLMGVTPAAAGGDNDRAVPAVFGWQAYLAGGTERDPGFDVFAKRPEVNVEAIAAARPDLIISQSGWLEDIEPRLRDLGVPIVVFAWDDAPDWRNNVRIVAEAVGRDQCADEIVGTVEAAIDDTRGSLEASGAADRTYSAFLAAEDYHVYYGAEDPIGITLQEELGLDLVPNDGAQTEFSVETAGDVLVGDVLLATDFDGDGYLQQFLASPTMAPIADRVAVLDPTLAGAAYYPSAVGLRLFLDFLEQRFG
jgi:ABC-type Fe3+-hydroxamate transport system substrate-binding protein